MSVSKLIAEKNYRILLDLVSQPGNGDASRFPEIVDH